MNKFKSTVLSALFLAGLFASSAFAANRTFVSSTGNDANTASNCARATPCRNFSFALSVTSPGGEVVALDSQGFGTLYITFAVTITSIPGEKPFIFVGAGATGITVAAGSNDVVVLRNMAVSGLTGTTIGLQVNSGKVIVQNMSFTGLTVAVNDASKLDLIDSDFYNNYVALRANGTGTDTQSYPIVYGPTSVRISGGNFSDNTTAFEMINPGARPAPATDNKISIFIRLLGNSSADWSVNATGNAILAQGSGAGCPPPVPPDTYQPCQNVGSYSGGSNPR